MGAAITGWGSALPSTELTNAELARRYDVTEDWIIERTGILTRRIAADGETTTSLATEAGLKALRRAGVEGADLDMVIVATATPDYVAPATASLVQSALGADDAGGYDVMAGCAGFLYALAQASAMVDSGSANRILICGVDLMSRLTDYADLKSAILFGDAAGAVVVENVEGTSRLGPFVLRSDGSKDKLLFVRPEDRLIQMEGREVYRHAVAGMTTSVQEILAAARITVEDVDLLVAHQANARILSAVVGRLGFAPDQVFSNITNIGNTSAASVPVALVEAADRGILRDGDLTVLTAFGVGFAWGAAVVKWGIRVPDSSALALTGRIGA